MEEYQRGARTAWECLRLGEHPVKLLAQAEGNLARDHFNRGWRDQCLDPDRELHPPDYIEPPDYAVLRGVLIGTSLVGLAACVVSWLKFGFSPFAAVGIAVFALVLIRALKLPAQ